MPLLIDTYNVLHTTGVMPPDLAGNDLPWLIRLIEGSRYRDDRTTLACDGAPLAVPGARPVQQVGNVIIRYSGKGRPADDLIAQLIRASTAPRRLIVVSTDHAILRAARRRRCKFMTSEEFLQTLADDNQTATAAARPRKPTGGMSDKQVDHWVNVFNLDERTLAIGTDADPPSPSPNDSDDSLTEAAQESGSAASAQQNAENPSTRRQVRAIKRGPLLPPNLVDEAERLWAKAAKPTPAPPVDPNASTGDDENIDAPA